MVYFVSYKAFLIFIYRRIRSTREKPINCWTADEAIRYSLIITCHHFHYENRLSKPSLHISTRILLYSKHFSYRLSVITSSDSNSPTDDSELHSVFRWSLSKNQNHQSKTDDTPSRVLLKHPFTKSISIMKKVGQPHFG